MQNELNELNDKLNQFNNKILYIEDKNIKYENSLNDKDKIIEKIHD